jgi:hypothetical protein
MTRWRFFLAQITETALWVDQGCNVLAGWVSFLYSIVLRRSPPHAHSADETVSAHLYRSAKAGKLWGRVLMPPVDKLFSLWQRNPDGSVVLAHCKRAFEKERDRFYLPADYREPTTPTTP